ncbi:MAG TPA: DNA-3-methyladenine glycosylase [Chthoniobacterales bacterium]|nr:DNA-3-methyladenine glycosylase [Chthoniobacterales bacterium]
MEKHVAAVKTSPIDASFFMRDPLVCARELVGTELVWEKCSGIVVETEAYLTLGDEACHTFARPSAREFVERNTAGAIYIYLNYGVHWMLNVLVKGGARSGLILIRALEPRRGLSLMRARRGVEDVHRLCSGPGKLAQALDITKRHHELNLCTGPRYRLMREENLDVPVTADPRIGISRATDLPWRFTLAGSPFVSVAVRPPNARKRLTRAGTARTFTAR